MKVSRLLVVFASILAIPFSTVALEAQRGNLSNAFNKTGSQLAPRSPSSPTVSSRSTPSPTQKIRSSARPTTYNSNSRIEAGGILGTQPGKTSNRPRLANTRPIGLDEQSLQKIRKMHVVGGGSATNKKSQFYRNQNIEALIKRAEGRPAYWQKDTGNFRRVIRADHPIGIDNSVEGVTEPTSIYTVITDSENKLKTAFPGLPRHWE